MSEEADAEWVDLLLFEVGDRVYGADATQVVRVDSRARGAGAGGPLGPLHSGARTLVFRRDEGEGQLAIDAVRGVRRARPVDLRRLPASVPADGFAIGVWLDGETPIVLIDLSRATSFP